MKLTELNPRVETSEGNNWEYLIFDCPKCLNQPLGENEIKHSFAIPVSVGHPNHWNLFDRNFESLTLSPSILDLGKCQAHFFITKGEIVLC